MPQFITPTEFLLPAGDYFFAFNSTATTNAVMGTTTTAESQRFAGILQQAVGAVALPNPATPIAPTVNWRQPLRHHLDH